MAKAVYGSKLLVKGNSAITFINNVAQCGGALFCSRNTVTTFNGKSTAIFYHNPAKTQGGSLMSELNSVFYIKGQSTFILTNKNDTINQVLSQV